MEEEEEKRYMKEEEEEEEKEQANLHHHHYHHHQVDIPNSQPLRKLPPIHHTASLTQPLPVQPSAQYSPPLLKDWEGAGMCVGGINAPIRLTVRTCDGAKNFELLKGRDDVRQDAVMEQDILEHFHPVFQHFFLEQYRSPHSWLQRRLAYTKSVATTSIIGYIVGLGDRHPENILLDKTTAELIHIDLGIAFELGKILPTPETVPFRMTQVCVRVFT
ncbi:Serine-protein kinase ATM [Portunus trituberculatus]|uniref:Serine-protein kinase ATM n=1 Tax=Portunus trituberculatus TaxID=210409 RepID=A0A5B7EIW7_PORTR|nr:Serine-protein kinase ATM [Portunus trituberculatus]